MQLRFRRNCKLKNFEFSQEAKMSVRSYSFLFIMFCLPSLIFADNGIAKDWSQKYPIEKDIPGPYSYDSISQKNYKGITLNILTHEKPVMGEPTQIHAGQFEEKR
ncbi:MAG: hypothetical protein B6245_01180 [Desulfobacteraceae bacterium 4572_88]|nr:MAG: hypothetical protein B6245_01180 [Desulfobacteraceae bacterium 4572_88]